MMINNSGLLFWATLYMNPFTYLRSKSLNIACFEMNRSVKFINLSVTVDVFPTSQYDGSGGARRFTSARERLVGKHGSGGARRFTSARERLVGKHGLFGTFKKTKVNTQHYLRRKL